MKISINSEVLSKYNLSLGEFLIMLMGFHRIDYESCFKSLINKGLIYQNIYNNVPAAVLDNKGEALVNSIIIESDDKMLDCEIKDFEALAKKLQEYYPEGNKSGTTYPWRGTTQEIAQKLRALVVIYGFTFTEEEAINAVKEYISTFNDYRYMALLKYFILRTSIDDKRHKNIDSMFMTIIENNREK